MDDVLLDIEKNHLEEMKKEQKSLLAFRFDIHF